MLYYRRLLIVQTEPFIWEAVDDEQTIYCRRGERLWRSTRPKYIALPFRLTPIDA